MGPRAGETGSETGEFDSTVDVLAGSGAAEARVDHAAKAEAGGVELAMGSALTVDSLGEYVGSWWARIRSGQSGALPVLVGLVAIVVIFQVQNSVFLSAGNITNLFVQAATFVLFGMAEVFVLLLGEIDLSAGYVGGIGAVVMAELVGPAYQWPWWAAILVALAGVAVIGVVNGLLVTMLHLPSFVVTLAGLLGFEGVLIYLVDGAKDATGGTIQVSNNVISDLVNGTITPVAGWIGLAVAVIVYAAVVLRRDGRRRSSGLAAPPISLSILKVAAAAVAGAVLVAVCNTNRGRGAISLTGVPWVIPVLLVVFVAWTFLLGRTRYGRYVYAIGGNAEAARRAGVNNARITIVCFMLSSMTAGMAGIVYTSRLGSISNNIDGGTLVLDAVAAAVIGGASLFGGRGKMLDAVLGAIVIAAIYNGLGILGVGAATQDMVTGLVLLAAVAVDRLARRGRSSY